MYLTYGNNSKVGQAYTTSLSVAATCLTTCHHHPSRHGTCYAIYGPSGMAQRRLANRTTTEEVTEEVTKLKTLPTGALVRIHAAGDFANTRHALRVSNVVRRLKLKAWSYTHRWRTIPASAHAGASVLASCETLADVKEAHARGYAPALVVDAFKSTITYSLGNGFKGIPCPNQTHANVTCADCKLCLRADWLHSSKSVILFEAHGTRARKLRESLIQIGA